MQMDDPVFTFDLRPSVSLSDKTFRTRPSLDRASVVALAAQRGTAMPQQADCCTRAMSLAAGFSAFDGARAVQGRNSHNSRLGTERPALGANGCWC